MGEHAIGVGNCPDMQLPVGLFDEEAVLALLLVGDDADAADHEAEVFVQMPVVRAPQAEEVRTVRERRPFRRGLNPRHPRPQ